MRFHLNQEVKGLSEHSGERLEDVGLGSWAGAVAAWGVFWGLPQARKCALVSLGQEGHEGTSRLSVLLGVFVPPGGVPCRLRGWSETIPFSKKPSPGLRLTWLALGCLR